MPGEVTGQLSGLICQGAVFQWEACIFVTLMERLDYECGIQQEAIPCFFGGAQKHTICLKDFAPSNIAFKHFCVASHLFHALGCFALLALCRAGQRGMRVAGQPSLQGSGKWPNRSMRRTRRATAPWRWPASCRSTISSSACSVQVFLLCTSVCVSPCVYSRMHGGVFFSVSQNE